MKARKILDLFRLELRVMYDAEQRHIRVLDDVSQQVADADLQGLFREHAKASSEQLRRLEKVFSELQDKPKKRQSSAAKGLLRDLASVAKDAQPSPEVLDVYLVGGAMRFELYEISSYAFLVEHARLARHDEAASLLELNLIEEGETYATLQRLSGRLSQQFALA